MTQEYPVFRYHTGEQVFAGDRVKAWEWGRWLAGRVTRIVACGEQVSEDLVCGHGGVFIEVAWEKSKGLVLETPADGVLDEDYVLVARDGG